MLIQFLIGFIGIGLVVLVHETGHFLAARALGVRVEIFGIGMGPVLFSLHSKNTEFRFSLIPFGGYCQMDGSIDLVKALRDDMKTFTKTESGSYFATTPLVRLIIFLAGPLINFILSVLLFFLVSIIPTWSAENPARITLVSDYEELFHSDIRQDELRSGDILLSVDGVEVRWYSEAEKIFSSSDKKNLPVTVSRDGQILSLTAYGTPSSDGSFRYGISLWQDPVIGRVEEGSPFMTHDRIISVNGNRIENSYDFYLHCNEEMNVTVLRDGENVSFTIPPSVAFPFAWESTLVPLESQGFFSSLLSGISRTLAGIRDTISSLAGLVRMNSEEVRNEITGPTRAAMSIGSITTLGLETDAFTSIRAFLYLLALVSVSLCVANLLPVPVFDGGQMIINLFQIVTKKEMSPHSYVIFHIAGLICTVLIFIALYALDIMHYLSA